MADTVIFDGDCGVCTATVERIRRYLPANTRFRAHQALSAHELQRFGLTPAACARSVQFIASSGRVSSGGAACVDLLERSTTPLRRLAFVARLPVMRTLVDALYRAVAANRTAISKALGLVACRVPDP